MPALLHVLSSSLQSGVSDSHNVLDQFQGIRSMEVRRQFTFYPLGVQDLGPTLLVHRAGDLSPAAARFCELVGLPTSAGMLRAATVEG